MMTRLIILLGCFALASGCSDDSSDTEAFATYQQCFNEHHETEAFPTIKAIEICCIDHPIGNAAANVVCGGTSDTCETYATANLSMSSATADEIATACTAYISDRSN